MINKKVVPFNRPCFAGNELTYITEAINRGHISGDGHFTRKCSRYFEERLGVPKVLLTTSCTHALEMAAILLDIKPGDEVIVPSFTFVSTANAFVLRGAKPIFADIRPDTLNMDEKKLLSLISPRTKAVVPVHYAGVGCEMDRIMDISKKKGIEVIEDNAHGLFGKYKGKWLGTFGSMATQSFHETKNFFCGEGGALLLNNEKYIERAEIIREKGTNRSKFFRAEVDKYSWIDVGSSYLPSDILAAFLWAQIEARNQIQNNRKKLWEYYMRNLVDWAQKHDVGLPIIPPNCDQAYHSFYLVMPSFELRQAFIEYLKARNIISVFHYLPLHLSDIGKKFGGKEGDCPIAENIGGRLVRLPFYNGLSQSDQQRVVKAVLNFNWK